MYIVNRDIKFLINKWVSEQLSDDMHCFFLLFSELNQGVLAWNINTDKNSADWRQLILSFRKNDNSANLIYFFKFLFKRTE